MGASNPCCEERLGEVAWPLKLWCCRVIFFVLIGDNIAPHGPPLILCGPLYTAYLFKVFFCS